MRVGVCVCLQSSSAGWHTLAWPLGTSVGLSSGFWVFKGGQGRLCNLNPVAVGRERPVVVGGLPVGAYGPVQAAEEGTPHSHGPPWLPAPAVCSATGRDTEGPAGRTAPPRPRPWGTTRLEQALEMSGRRVRSFKKRIHRRSGLVRLPADQTAAPGRLPKPPTCKSHTKCPVRAARSMSVAGPLLSSQWGAATPRACRRFLKN